jgi:hypothetical protein
LIKFIAVFSKYIQFTTQINNIQEIILAAMTVKDIKVNDSVKIVTCIPVIARSASDAAISLFYQAKSRLLRFARKDGSTIKD